MKASEVLKKAKARIQDPTHWCKGWYAKDHDGDDTFSTSSHAVRWCSFGALLVSCYNDQENRDIVAKDWAYEYLIRCVPDGRLTTFNDAVSTTHADVMATFDKAIALAEEEESKS